jgi:hypothetical protein
VHRLTTLHVKGLTRSVLVAPVVRGSVMLSDVHDSVIILGGRQVRNACVPRSPLAQFDQGFRCPASPLADNPPSSSVCTLPAIPRCSST